jgi:Flp pilus assembly protein protease CpaA
MYGALIGVVGVWVAVLCWFDWRSRRLPNWLTMGGGAIALAFRLGWGGPWALADGVAAGCAAGLLLFVPYLAKGAGAGDVKMLAAAGAITGLAGVVVLLLVTAVAGVAMGVALLTAGVLDGARVRHYLRCLFNWRYDRRAGAAGLPPRDSERVRMPFSIPIGVGLLTALCLGG